MDNLNTSLSSSISYRQRRSGRYGLKETFIRTYSLPTGSSYILDSNRPKCEILPVFNNDLEEDSRPRSSLNHNITDTDSAEYISYFNTLSLGEKLGKYPVLSEHFPVNTSESSSQLYRHNSLPCNNSDVASYADSLILDTPISSSGSIVSESYISPITRSLKRRKVSFASSSIVSEGTPLILSSDNEVNDNDSLNKSIGLINDYSSSLSVSEVENYGRLQLFNMIRTVIFNIFRIFINVIIISLILLSIVFMISFYVQYNIKTCTDANNVPIPIKYIKNNLTQSLIGQESAISAISDSIERYNYRKFSLGLLWMVGSIGVGKSKSLSLIRNAFGNQIKLHSIYGTLLPSDVHLMEEVAIKLVNELDSCRPNVIIYDEFDDEVVNIRFITLLLKFLKYEKTWPTVTHGNHMKIYFIISGLYRHELITESYTEHIISGGLRHNFNYGKLKNELQNLSILRDFPFHDVNFAPFLPLEEEHLIKCIHQEINLFSKKKIDSSDMDDYFKTKNLSLQYIYDTVKTMSNLSPFEHKKNLIIISGCKRVHKTVNLLLTKSSEICS